VKERHIYVGPSLTERVRAGVASLVYPNGALVTLPPA
jgi:hypothetical protein